MLDVYKRQGYTWGLVGFFGRINYAYAGRYLVELSARYDGSSKFPANSQWGFFPSASVGWRLSEEPWLKPHVEGWLDNFKIRASIGSLGNANICLLYTSHRFPSRRP